MATSLPPEVAASYSAIIDSILSASDLNTISAKRIRKGLQEKVGLDISHQKEQVTELIMQRFDKFNNERNGSEPEPAEPIPTVEAPATNGKTAHTDTSEDGSGSVSKKRTPDDDDDDDSALSELEQSPPKKKQKRVKMEAEEDDAAYAARLQAEENARVRSRSTRGGNTKKKAPVQKKQKQKKKSANKVKDEDDSDLGSGSDGEKKEVKRTGGFHKLMALSPPLADLLGETTLSRPQTVKRIWAYVKERDLQDPSDKRQIRCDDALRKVFKQDRVHMFTMNKILNQNLYALDE